MLAIVAVALLRIVATLVVAKDIDIGRCKTRFVGIHVPHLAIGCVVGGLKVGPQVGIGGNSMSPDNIVKGCSELRARLTRGGEVITLGRLGH